MFLIKDDATIKEKFIKVMSFVSLTMLVIVSILSYNGSKEKLDKSVEKNLNLLSESIYQSMTNSMLAGNPIDVENAEKNSKELDGVDYLKISKSKQVIKDFASSDIFTTDPKILEIFRNKEKVLKEINKNGKHQMVILKPFIAQDRCLQCHVNSKNGDVLGVMELRVSLEESDANTAIFTTMVVLSNVLMGLIFMGLVWYLLNKFVSNPLNDMIKVVKSLSESNRDLTKRIPVKSNDDLGKLSSDFNKYLTSIEDNSKQEKIFINEARKSIELAKQGWYKENITAAAPGKTLNDFKESVNCMIDATYKNFNTLNQLLQQYKNHDYTNELKIEGLKKDGEFDTLVGHINGFRNVITQMLINDKNNGTKLNQTSNILLENMTFLSNSSKITEQSLQDVNSELKNITDNISQNTNNISLMSKINNDVTQSSKSGEHLANKTYESMNDINKHVSEINEAIEVIDQISFQTNILSLNAAVEAATAGEAGKGFAVVASEVRNLASKSAEAALKIKELVENATTKSIQGQNIAQDMIDGYKNLNEDITTSVEYFLDIEKASTDQLNSIDKINRHILDVTTQINEKIEVTNKTKDVALETDEMAKHIVSKVNEKKFLTQIMQ